jgi:hypothetical protein
VGGDDDRQAETTRRIIEYLGYGGSGVESSEVTGKIFSTNSATFRAGQIETWRNELPADLAAETYERCGPLMEQWGYGP